ncbi:MAG: maltokinase N-terminal cap-like domain-containing protein [Sporichthyaceae bacterium]
MTPEDLARWMSEQRWFAGKGRTLERLTHTEIATLSTDPLVRLDAIEVDYADGGSHTYHVPVAYREHAPPELAHALIGHGEPGPDGTPCFAYDAMHDKTATRAWLTGMTDAPDDGGLAFHLEADTTLPTDADSTILTGEQSNTTVVFGESTILKVFRRLADGLNPDAELLHALHEAGNPFVPRLQGWVEGTWTSAAGTRSTATLALATEFLPNASSGWDLALTSMRGLLADPGNDPGAAGGDFGGEAMRLGEATATVHLDLARMLGTETVESHVAAGALIERLNLAVLAAPELATFAAGVREHYDRLAERTEPITVQRVHGDLHLGQVLRIPAGWRILDFEGEPGTPTAERRELQSPLKDVAGMLRSFDYAAQHLLGNALPGTGNSSADQEIAAQCAQAWATRNQQKFCAGYRSVDGAPADDDQVLHAFLLDKAVYEVVYEIRHRPDWLAVPLAAVQRLLDDAGLAEASRA